MNCISIKKEKYEEDGLINTQPFEITERKGIGHPDTICDGAMDAASIALAKTYLKMFGRVLHFNLDKSLLTAGTCVPKFGGGTIEKGMKMVLGDRATYRVDDEFIPVDKIVTDAIDEWIQRNLWFNPMKNIFYQSEIAKGSDALQDIFKRNNGKYLGSNDTSAVVGYSPVSTNELLICDLEYRLRSMKSTFPEIGSDIKIMSIRKGSHYDITVAIAMIDTYINSVTDYVKSKNSITSFLYNYMYDIGFDIKKVKIKINALDDPGRGINGLYLTHLGTSADSGDSGQVGRGNDTRGVIPLCRPAGAEAASGKNPVSHVGKIYGLFANNIADQIVQDLDVDECYVWLVGQIGKPINDPNAVMVKYKYNGHVSLTDEINNIVEDKFSKLDEFCTDLINGKYTLC